MNINSKEEIFIFSMPLRIKGKNNNKKSLHNRENGENFHVPNWLFLSLLMLKYWKIDAKKKYIV
jgi:hypothetical protein